MQTLIQGLYFIYPIMVREIFKIFIEHKHGRIVFDILRMSLYKIIKIKLPIYETQKS